MHWTRCAGLVALTLALHPAGASAQVVIRDDVTGWGWLSMQTARRAVVGLAYASSQSSQEGRLDDEVLRVLRDRGVRRLFAQSSFDPSESQVLAECTGTDWVPQGATQVQLVVHAEISYWDHTRLAATEIYEALSIGSAVPEAYSTEVYVQGCARLVADVLVELGFDQG
jgi:hypothetical protein